ncbi:MAG: hypothetical protein AABM66_14215 [Actinomycetota bacterium]
MVSGPTQLLHGLRLSGDVAVPCAAMVADGKVDFEVHLDAPSRPANAAPPGELVAALETADARYAAALRGDELTVRFFATGEFEVDLAKGTIVARPAPGRGEAMVPVLLAGNLLAIVLGLRGAAVLHASAVELNGAAVAFVGPTGAGKSTVAALLCAAGGAIVGDDAARVEEGEGGPLVHHGPHELRLRPQAAAIADHVGGATGTTADGRVAVEARPAAGDATRLGAIVFPSWPGAAGEPSVVRLPPRRALELLLRCPRVTGWRVTDPVRAHFVACAAVAQVVPAFRAELPQERLQDSALPEALRDALAVAGALEPDGSQTR